MNAFTTYIQPVFHVYNSEIWNITKSLVEIDAFQRRLLKTYVLNVKWPETMKNESVYEKTKTGKRSDEIRKSGLKWF